MTNKQKYHAFFDRELPPPIAERAKRNLCPSYPTRTFPSPTMSEVIDCAFHWSSTPEGHDFWSNVCHSRNRYGRYNLPSCKNLQPLE